jgi:hypothetical protein
VVFRTAREGASPEGREEMDVRSRQVTSTHAWRERWSRRSEISSSAEGELCAGATSSGVVGLTLASAFFFNFPAACLGAAGDLISGFLEAPVFQVAVTLGCLGSSVTG